MFIVHFKDGETFTEEKGTWDDVPNKPITRLEITLPFIITGYDPQTGKNFRAPSPAVGIGGYDKYYCANVAVATIFKGENGKFTVGSGHGEVVAKTMTGIDEKRDFALIVTVDRKGNTDIKRMKYSRWVKELRIRTNTFRPGVL